MRGFSGAWRHLGDAACVVVMGANNAIAREGPVDEAGGKPRVG